MAGKLLASRGQSYDRELQRQSCKKLQRHEYTGAFWKQNKKLFLHLGKTLYPTTYNAGIVVANSEVVGLAPEISFLQWKKVKFVNKKNVSTMRQYA
jgi:hypothetical protein